MILNSAFGIDFFFNHGLVNSEYIFPCYKNFLIEFQEQFVQIKLNIIQIFKQI